MKVRLNDRSQIQINKIKSQIFKTQKDRVQKAGAYLKSKILEAMSVKTFSLQELQNKKHPYAKKRFPSKINTAAISPLKSYNIHDRSGDLKKSVRSMTKTRKQASGDSFYVTIYNINTPEYAKYVFEGTKILIGRNPFSAMYKDKKVQARIKQILEGK